MSGSSFDAIAREVLKQKQLMERMEEENRLLRQQLADLRAGYGLYVEIEGKRFALAPSTQRSASPSPSVQPVAQANHAFADGINAEEVTLSSATTSILPPTAAPQSTVSITENEEHEAIIVEPVAEADMDIANEMTMSIPEANLHPPSPASTPVSPRKTVKLAEKDAAPTFLEEVMIDEFAAAATSPLSIWSGPPAPHTPQTSHIAQPPHSQQSIHPEELDEVQKADLRRQLSDSFILG